MTTCDATYLLSRLVRKVPRIHGSARTVTRGVTCIHLIIEKWLPHSWNCFCDLLLILSAICESLYPLTTFIAYIYKFTKTEQLYFCKLANKQSDNRDILGSGKDTTEYDSYTGSVSGSNNLKWVPSTVSEHIEPSEFVFRSVRSILNKLTPENFNKLSEQLARLDITTEKTLKGTVILVFQKAITEAGYSFLYATLCVWLDGVLPNFDTKPSGTTTFRRLLVRKCREEFEKRNNYLLPEDDRTDQQRALEKRNVLGNITFIGELFKVGIIHESTIHQQIIQSLLERRSTWTIPELQQNIECLCTLLQSIGQVLDSSEAKVWMDRYFERMTNLSLVPGLPPRSQYALKDIADLRQNNWFPRCHLKSHPKGHPTGHQLEKRIHPSQGSKFSGDFPASSQHHQDKSRLPPGGFSHDEGFGTPPLVGMYTNQYDEPGDGEDLQVTSKVERVHLGEDHKKVDNTSCPSNTKNTRKLKKNFSDRNEISLRPSTRKAPPKPVPDVPQDTPEDPSNTTIGGSVRSEDEEEGKIVPSTTPFRHAPSTQPQFYGEVPSDPHLPQGFSMQRPFLYSSPSGSPMRPRPPDAHLPSHIRMQSYPVPVVGLQPHPHLTTGPLPFPNMGDQTHLLSNIGPQTHPFPNMVPQTRPIPHPSMYGPQERSSPQGWKGPQTAPPTSQGAPPPWRHEAPPIKVISSKSSSKGGKKSHGSANQHKKSPSNSESERQVESILERYLETQDLKTSVMSISNLNVLSGYTLCKVLLSKSLERSEDDRVRVSGLLHSLMDEGVFSLTDYKECISSTLKSVQGGDCSQYQAYIAGFIARTVASTSSFFTDALPLFSDGAHHPTFLFLLQILVSLLGQDEVGVLLKEKNVRIVDFVPAQHRATDNLMKILEERKLEFLYPVRSIQKELATLLREGKSVVEVYKWILTQVDASMYSQPDFIAALTSCIVVFVTSSSTVSTDENPHSPTSAAKEKEKKLFEEYKALIERFTMDNAKLQLVVVYATQSTCHGYNFPKGLLLRLFNYLYEMDVVEEDVFHSWKEDMSEEYPGKEKALFQVNQWLNLLAAASSEVDSSDSDDDS